MTVTGSTSTSRQMATPSNKDTNRNLNNRPNRHFTKYDTDDISIITSYGDTIHKKHESHTRIFFQNVKGLSYSTSGEELRVLHSGTKDNTNGHCWIGGNKYPVATTSHSK